MSLENVAGIMAIFGRVFDFLLAIMSVWRLTYMVMEEHGPWDIFGRFKDAHTGWQVIGASRHLVSKDMIGDILICVYCCSVWISAPVAVYLAWRWADWQILPLLWLSQSALAILIELARRKYLE